MGEINYAPVIQDMVWSYSRIKSFGDCPYRWYLRYIRKLKGRELFFANYGSFMHKLIELYYTDGKTPGQLCDMYMCDFKKQVRGNAPNPKIFGNYFRSGLQYLREFTPFPCRPLAVEKRVDFCLDTIPFIGYIDFLGEKDGDLYIIDNKSRNLRPRSNRAKPTKTDAELDEYPTQLYLYSAAVEQEYGKRPKALCFNCFREQSFIVEPFSDAAYAASRQWLSDKVAEITRETEFKPNAEFFKCRHLCEMQEHCEYYELTQKR